MFLIDLLMIFSSKKFETKIEKIKINGKIFEVNFSIFLIILTSLFHPNAIMLFISFFFSSTDKACDINPIQKRLRLSL